MCFYVFYICIFQNSQMCFQEKKCIKTFKSIYVFDHLVFKKHERSKNHLTQYLNHFMYKPIVMTASRSRKPVTLINVQRQIYL